MRLSLLGITALLTLSCTATNKSKEIPPYKNKSLPIELRINDLLKRMTLEEKVGQLRCTLAWNYYTIKGNNVVPSESFKKDIKEGNIGMLWATFRADPWTQKTLENGLTPELAAKASNALQKYVMENTRLGIPLFLAEEAPHGHMAIGTTVFPTGIGMAATWSPSIAEETGKVVSKEIRLQGAHISYGPVIDLSREPRWGRVEESYGEDPVLTASLAASLIKGLGAGRTENPYATLATLKHFIGYGTTEGGQNGGPTVIGMRNIHQNFLYPFKKAIEAGALSVMTSYNALDGIPSTCNSYFLKNILRDKWHFQGFVVSDLYSIDGISGTHKVARNSQEAGVMSLEAGLDVDLGANAFGKLPDAVRKGMVSEEKVDSAVAHVLRQKFKMGLFENPYVDPKKARDVRNASHIEVAHKAALASITLLKNSNHTLPLQKDIKVAVIGPNADNVYNMLGDYTSPQASGNVITILEGIKSKLPANNVTYVKGCAIRDTTNTNIPEAVVAAKKSDVIVVAVGGSSARDFSTKFKATGAAETDTKSLSDMDCGEGFDRSTLNLLGKQEELLKALKNTEKPMIVVYIEGRPLLKNWSAENADALLTAYYPGQQGGLAIADVLFGDYNPAGRLPFSVPRSTGQLPVYYNKTFVPHDYAESPATPLYSFGYGLSYTTFEYKNLNILQEGKTDFNISFDVTNTGSMNGEEVPQLYLHDVTASVVQPVLQLKHFERIMIKKGETKHITFHINAEDLSIIDKDLNNTVEPGDFDIFVGSSSDNILLKGKLTVD